MTSPRPLLSTGASVTHSRLGGAVRALTLQLPFVINLNFYHIVILCMLWATTVLDREIHLPETLLSMLVSSLPALLESHNDRPSWWTLLHYGW